ncbi:hypothetical protein GCM10011340_10440 [Roseivirga thermotolerans]|uniref:Uncharacterized protein n=2 Tax=Roseivirga TaxID=290180 RepID=A0ABQ3I5Y6_9BACT|nr:hypothetical protein GCM10011340_10440 [Roseivirga thermotolerans]
MVLLSMGLGLIAFASYYIIRLIDFLINTDDIIYIEQFVVPIIPLALGIVCLNNGLRRGEVLICTLKTGKVLRIPLLNKFEKAELEKVLRSQFKYK